MHSLIIIRNSSRLASWLLTSFHRLILLLLLLLQIKSLITLAYFLARVLSTLELLVRWMILLILRTVPVNHVVHHIHHNFLRVLILSSRWPRLTSITWSVWVGSIASLSVFRLQIPILWSILILLHLKHIYLCLQVISGLGLRLRLVIRSKIWLWPSMYFLLLLRSWLLNLIDNDEEILLYIIGLLLILIIILIIGKLLNQLKHLFILILVLILAVFVCWRLGSFAVRSHVEVGFVDIIILLSICSVIVDCCMRIVMVLYLNVWLWLWTSAVRFVLILVPVWLLLLFHGRVQNDPLLGTWRAKDTIVSEEVMEVLA